MRSTFGELSFEIPSGWSDETVVTLLGPVVEAPLMMRAKVREPQRANIVLRRQRLSGAPLPLETYVDAQAEMLRQLMPGLATVATAELRVIGGEVPAASREYTIPSEPSAVRQLHVYFVHRGAFFTLIASAPLDAEFSPYRAAVTAVGDSLRI